MWTKDTEFELEPGCYGVFISTPCTCNQCMVAVKDNDGVFVFKPEYISSRFAIETEKKMTYSLNTWKMCHSGEEEYSTVEFHRILH